MQSSPQLIVVETLFTASNSRRASYVLVQPKESDALESTPEAAAATFTLGLSRPQTLADAAAIFVLAKHDDDEASCHGIREGVLLEADEVMQRQPDEETATVRMWLVAEI